jgi:GT2 family glycosyltransferase
VGLAVAKPPLITVVIPTWNHKEALISCLKALKPQVDDVQVIVVDNGSADGSAELVERDYAWVKLIKHATNQGFAGGVNAGIRASQSQYVALLNNDAIVAAGWLQALVKFLETHPQAGAVTSKILHTSRDQDGRPIIDSTGECLSTWGMPFPRGREEADQGQYDQRPEVFGCSGGATLYRKRLFDEIGLFDERFFAYYEDVDISFRGRLAGYSFYYCPQAVVHHEAGTTSGGPRSAFTRYHTAQNLFYLYVKNMPLPLLLKYSPLFVAGAFLTLGGSIIHGLIWPHTRAAARAIINIPGVVADRRQIQRSRKISAAEVDRLLYHHLPPRQTHMLKSYLWFSR